MTTEIQDYLQKVETDYQIKIIYACESGSRAWGFPSPDSDYDVRFIYQHPVEWYLSLEEKSDTIHQMPNNLLDAHGWDIRKFLRLAYRSNAILFEWLHSPIIYRQETELMKELRQATSPYFSQKKIISHYLGIARRMLELEFKGDQVKIKKYFYVLRPILAARWVMKYNSVPPVKFKDLIPLTLGKRQIQEAINDLLRRKESANEADKIEKIPILDAFVQDQMSTCTLFARSLERNKKPLNTLDDFYRKMVLQK